MPEISGTYEKGVFIEHETTRVSRILFAVYLGSKTNIAARDVFYIEGKIFSTHVGHGHLADVLGSDDFYRSLTSQLHSILAVYERRQTRL